jgi:ABC-type branched-subunit amino acid transport system permease subunit
MVHDRTEHAMSGSQFIELFVGGLAIGCIYSLIALGFTMIIRATGVLHFAQGEVVMLGAMFGVTAHHLLPLRFIALLVVGMVFGGLAAVAIELGVYRTLRVRRAPLMNIIIATVGMSSCCRIRVNWCGGPSRSPIRSCSRRTHASRLRSGDWYCYSANWGCRPRLGLRCSTCLYCAGRCRRRRSTSAIEEALFVLAALLHSSIAMARPLAPHACAW